LPYLREDRRHADGVPPRQARLVEILSGKSTEPHRIAVIVALCLIAALAIVATEALFR
jgi:hypothetical protein